jgi:hypothetical protein
MYVFGGASLEEGQPGINTVENYNIASNHWGTKANMLGGAGGIHGVGDINGKLYLPGGISYGGDGYVSDAGLRIYNPAADTWTWGADMPVASCRTGTSRTTGVRRTCIRPERSLVTLNAVKGA